MFQYRIPTRCFAPFFFFFFYSIKITRFLRAFQKMKSLIRKRNGGNPGRLTRVLSQKSLNVSSNSPAPKSPPRTFLLETPVQFTTVSKFSNSRISTLTPMSSLSKLNNQIADVVSRFTGCAVAGQTPLPVLRLVAHSKGSKRR